LRLEASGDQLELEGSVRGALGCCRLRANALHVDLSKGTLEGEQVNLCAGHAALWAHKLRLGPGRALEARLLRGTPCACAGCPGPDQGPVRFNATRAWIAPGGRRLHLSWPVLRLGRVPVAALPYLALPLGPGVSGLLPPELGYSGRDGLRLALPLYLAGAQWDLLVAPGWIQERGAAGRARVRVYHENAEIELRGAGLRDDGQNRGQIRGRLVARAGGPDARLAVALAPDLVSDPDLTRELDRDVDRVLAPYLRSRAWGWASAGALYLTPRGDLYQHLASPSPYARGLLGAAGLDLGLAPVRLAGPAHLSLHGGLDHWSGIQAAAGSTTHVSRVRLDPELSVADMLGPLRISTTGRYLLRVAAEPGAVEGIQGGLLRLEASLPLARRFGSIVHLVEPVLALGWGTTSAARVRPDGLVLQDGATARLGMRTELWRRDGESLPTRALSLQVGAEATDLGELPEQFLVAGELELSLRRILSTRLTASWAPDPGRLTELRGRLCVGGGPRACAGYNRLRLLRVGELFRELDLAPGWGLDLPDLRADQVFATLRGEVGPLALGGLAAWDPLRRELTHAGLSASVGLGCGCYRVGLEGAYREGQRWPDVMLTLGFGGGGLSCL